MTREEMIEALNGNKIIIKDNSYDVEYTFLGEAIVLVEQKLKYSGITKFQKTVSCSDIESKNIKELYEKYKLHNKYRK